MNPSQKMPSDLRLVIPATVEELEVWRAETGAGQQDLYLVAAASRLDVRPNQVTQTQRSLMKVTLMSVIYAP